MIWFDYSTSLSVHKHRHARRKAAKLLNSPTETPSTATKYQLKSSPTNKIWFIGPIIWLMLTSAQIHTNQAIRSHALLLHWKKLVLYSIISYDSDILYIHLLCHTNRINIRILRHACARARAFAARQSERKNSIERYQGKKGSELLWASASQCHSSCIHTTWSRKLCRTLW